MEQSIRLAASLTEEGRYRLLVEAIRDYAIYMLDRDGVVTSWNAGAQRFKGYREDEIIGQHFSRFYTEEDRAAGLPQHALRIAASEGVFEREGWRVRKDGGRFWAHVVIDPVYDSEGDLVGFAKITRDLTERRAAEEALFRSEQQLRILVQGVTDYAIYLLDPQGRVSSWNAGAQRIKGYSPEDIIGHHFSRFYTEEDRAAGLPAVSLETAAREGRFEREGERVRHDGARFWAHVVIDAIRDEQGEVIGFAKVTRDITEKREAQRQLDQAREALFQAQKMDAIGQLTGGIAHDFNNLLMAVMGSLELVRKRVPYDPRISPLIDNAIQGAQRGSVLTQRMLAFARKQELSLAPVDVACLIRGMTGLMERTLGPQVDLQIGATGDLRRVRTDPAQLETALLNLAVNARDALEKGGTIKISAEPRRLQDCDPELAPGDYVCVTVRDTGVGMDEATVARASEPFFTTKGVGKGTGLGLSMVHGLMAQSGGALRIFSSPSEGTTVELWLPVDGENDGGSAVQPAPEYQEGETCSHRILVVDDDALVLMNTAALLEDLGHSVVQAASAKEALAIAMGDPAIELVVTDQAMPRMTGVELASALRQSRPELPVVIATGYAEIPADAGDELPRLAKPFTQSQLAEAVDAALGQVTPPRT